IFKTMADADISVDFISVSQSDVILSFLNEVIEQDCDLLEAKDFQLTVVKDCAKVSAVSAGMSGIPGVVSQITKALVVHDVEILQSADSHTTMWVLIHEKHLKTAVNALHDAFELNKLIEKEKELLVYPKYVIL